MNTIYKYKISPENFSNISKVEMPHDAKILSVGSQNNEVFVWAEVDTESSVFIKMFEVFGTGHEVKYDMGTEREFLGTAFLDNGLVFHIYERKN